MAAMLEVRAPAEQSEGTRSQVQRWLKAVGETVAENEPLIELETDKVTVEVASPAAGVLRQILKDEQTEIEPGEVLGLIESAAEVRAGAAEASGPAPGLATAGGVAGASGSPAFGVHTGLSSARPQQDSSASGPLAHTLSPAVKRLLAEHGIEAGAVRGTGKGGRITVDDVLAHVAKSVGGTSTAQAHFDARGAGTHSSSPEQSQATAPTGKHDAALAQGAHGTQARAGSAQQEAIAVPGTRRIPHSAVRKRVAEHMVRSLLHTAPHVTSVFEADMSAVLAHRAKHREEFERAGAPLTLTAYFLAAMVDAVRAVPEANSRWTDDALEIFDAVNIGIGTALGEQGLVVPVMQNVEQRSLQDIARELNSLVTRARDGKLTPEHMRGGTITISNHGVSGSLLATPIIINQPQSAILGVGKLEKRVVALTDADGADRFAVVPKCYVTLTIDHRVMDGFQANRFLQTFVQRLERWPVD